MTSKLRKFVILPPLAVLAFFVLRLLLPPEAEGAVNRSFNVAVFIIAATGCFAAGSSFQRGDYLRIGWNMQAAGSLLLAISSLLRGLQPEETILLARTPLVFMANAMTVIGAVIFARAHRVAGLELPWTPSARRSFFAVVTLLALLAVAPSIAVLVPKALGGDMLSWMQIFSGVGDFVFALLIAPIFMTALALRGGVLIWPWGLLTASAVSWLIYDAQDSVVYFFPQLEEIDLTLVTVPLRVLACLYLFAAALAQRRLTSGAVDRSGAT